MAVLNQELTGPADPTAGHPWLSQKTKSPLMPCATTAGCRIWTWFLPTHLHMPWLRLGLFPPPKHDLFVGKGQTKGTENSGKNPNPTFCFPWSPLFHFLFATKQPWAFFFFLKLLPNSSNLTRQLMGDSVYIQLLSLQSTVSISWAF